MPPFSTDGTSVAIPGPGSIVSGSKFSSMSYCNVIHRYSAPQPHARSGFDV